jgi:hypothetical protein
VKIPEANPTREFRAESDMAVPHDDQLPVVMQVQPEFDT